MTDSLRELLPCPFCGETACGTVGSVVGCASCDIWMTSKAWNRRALLTESAESGDARTSKTSEQWFVWVDTHGNYTRYSVREIVKDLAILESAITRPAPANGEVVDPNSEWQQGYNKGCEDGARLAVMHNTPAPDALREMKRLYNCLRAVTDGVGDGYGPYVEEARQAVIDNAWLDAPAANEPTHHPPLHHDVTAPAGTTVEGFPVGEKKGKP
jgi:hypothetical protein